MLSVVLPAALLLAAPSRAVDDGSLRHENSFGLFWDPYDYLAQQEPAALARQPGSRIYTQLSGMSDDTRLGGGFIGPLAGGVTGLMLDGQWASISSTATEQDSETGHLVETASWQREMALEGVLAWGRSLGDRLAVGGGLTAALDLLSSSMACVPWGEFSTDGETEVQWLDGQEIYRASGSLAQRSQTWGLVAGLSHGEQDRWLELDLRLQYTRAVPEALAELDEDGDDYRLAGFHPDEPWQGNEAAWIPGFRLDSLSSLRRRLDLRVLADVQAARGQVVVAESLQTLEVESSGETYTLTQQIKNDSHWTEQAWVLGVLHWTDGPLAVRMGLGAEWSHATYRYSHSWMSGWGASEASSSRVESGATALAFQVPLAFELQVHPAWTLRSGAAFWFEHWRGEETNEVEAVRSAVDNTLSSTSTQMALGLRYQPVDWLTLDTLFRSGQPSSVSGLSVNAFGTTGSSQAVSLSSLWLGAVFLIP